MKKILFSLIFIGTFFMSGCEPEVEIDDSKPFIELIGDPRIVIGIGDDFVDEGVNIIGDFEVDLRISGEVDTSTIGSYMIEYSLIYDGEYISKTRLVLVTTQTEADFNIRLEYIAKTEDSLTFMVSLHDEDGNLRNSVAKLYQGETVVSELYYGNGNNLLKFEGLDPDTYYQVFLEGSFTEEEESYSIGEYGLGITTLVTNDVQELVVSLNGDEFMTVVTGAEFVDPGAFVEGEPDIVIDFASNVNTNVPGIYHIVYTAVKDEIEYYAFRQVTVVEEENVISVVMRGEAEMNVNVNEIFLDPGAYVIGYTGEAVALITTESNVNIYTPGQYEIVYTTVIDGETYTATRVVNVLEVWSISGLFLNGDYDMTVGLYKSFDDPGAFFIGDPTVEISVVSTVNLYVAGDYTMIYTAVVGGVTHTATRIVHVVEETYDSVEVILLGEDEVTINVGEYFFDPGAFYVGTDAMLLMLTESTVDNTTPGDYTITYSVFVDDVQYSATRTVHVIPLEIPDFNVSITLDDVTPYSLSFTVTINDPDGVLAIANAELYDGEELVSYGDFEHGAKGFTFMDLSPNTTYTLVLDGQYMEDGYLTSFGDYELSGTTEDVVDPVITLDSYVVGVETFNAVLTVTDDYSQIDMAKLKIYTADDYLVAEEFLTRGNNDITFMFLQSETEYKAVIEYGYYEAGNWWTTDITELALTFTTNPMPMPVITDFECNTDNDDILCMFEFDETGFDDGIMYFAQLISGGFPIEIGYLDGNQLAFRELTVDTDYSVKIFATATETATGYSYTGDIGLFSTPTVELLPSPTIENITYSVTPHSITVDFTVVDWYMTFESGYVRLINGWSNVESIDIFSNGVHSVTFETGVDANDDYILDFRINYDNGDVYNYEEYESLLNYEVSTPPVVNLLEFTGAKTYFSGDNLVLSILLENDSDYDIEFVRIDGEIKEVFNFPSNNELLLVNMGPVTTGTNTYILNGIGINLNGGVYVYETEAAAIIQIYEPYSFDPEYASVVPLDFTTSEVGGTSFKSIPEDGSTGTTDLYIHLENEYALTVTGLGLFGFGDMVTDFVTLSPTLIKVSVDITEGRNIEGLSYIEYDKNGTTIRDTFVYNNYTSIFGYKSSERIAVGTVSEFLAINGNNNYYLTNDIDFGGIDVDPLGTYEDGIGGSFNGNGYALTNFNINVNVTDSESYQYIGLFGYSSMFLADFQIANSHIDVTTTDDSNFVYVGFLAGSQSSSVVNVDVNSSSINVSGFYKGTIGGLVGAYYDGYMDVFKNSSANDIDINVDAVALDEASYSLSVGGLIGYNNDGNILHSYATGTIDVTNTHFQTTNVGGLVGYMRNGGAYNYPSYILNSYADVDINSSGNYTGGMLGAGSDAFDQFIWLENVFALGDVHGDRGKVGGLVGYNVGKLVNGFATGDVDNTGGSVGYVIGYDYGLQGYRIENSFRYGGQSVTNYGSDSNGSDYYWDSIITASSSEYDSEGFYTDVLGFSSYFFDFGLLSVESDLLPTIN